MPDQRDDFEEQWARIVADLEAEAAAGATHGVSDDPADGEATSDAQHHDAQHHDAGRHDPPGGEARPPDGQQRDGQQPSTGSDGLAALFEPLRASEPPPDSFVDNWEDEGHFTPPPPPEIPTGTPVSRLAWAGTLGGPAVPLLLAITGGSVPPVVWIGASLAFLAGFATLVWRMPQSREDGWDDGARL